MAYIGYKKAASSTVVSKTLATMTGDGSDTTLTLLATPGSVNNVSVFLDGVFQTPGVHFTLAGNVITFTTAPASNVVVIALTGGGEHIGSPMAGSIKSADLGVGAVTSSKIASMDAAKLTGTYPALDASAVTGLTSANLTGTLPAISGAALTGVPSPFTESANDPATNTNPSGGLGTIWVNTTSGEMYACTDATTDANVWTNVGAGTGNIATWAWQGSNYGYSSAGEHATSPGVHPDFTTYEQFSFATEADSTHVGDTGAVGPYCTGVLSETTSYVVNNSIFKKVLFASGATFADVGTTPSKINSGQASHSNETHGYTGGGVEPTQSTTHKFAFASGVWSGQHGTLPGDPYNVQPSSHSDINGGYGYEAGGGYASTGSDTQITRFAFASGANQNGVNIGAVASNLTGTRRGGSSSLTHGYIWGGQPGPPYTAKNDKFAFASNANSALITDGAAAKHGGTGYSSETHGYQAGGTGGSSGNIQYKDIESVAFASDTVTQAVADMVSPGRQYAAGTHY